MINGFTVNMLDQIKQDDSQAAVKTNEEGTFNLLQNVTTGVEKEQVQSLPTYGSWGQLSIFSNSMGDQESSGWIHFLQCTGRSQRARGAVERGGQGMHATG